MPTLSELQREFIRAVFEPAEAPAVTPWIAGGGRGAHARLAVYRNNVWHNLREALRDVYPVVEQLVGREFFDAMATRFLREAGSGSGDLHRYGAGFAGFVDRFEPARSLPYLGDTARLEWRVHQAFHAADADALAVERLAGVDAADYGRLRFTLHPSCALMQSRWPVHEIRQANQPGADGRADLGSGAVDLLVRRAGGYIIEVLKLGAGEHALLAAFADGAALGTAGEAAIAAQPGFDLGEALRRHVLATTLVDFSLAPVSR